MKKSKQVFKLSLLSVALLGMGYLTSVQAQSSATNVGTVKFSG